MSIQVTDYSEAVEDAIAAFKKHSGRNEYPAGSNRTAYGKAYGWDGVFYCAIAIFVCVCIWGKSSAAMIKSASSSAIQRWGRSVGRNVSTPQRGDLIHVYKNGRSVHIEMVLSYSGGRLVCIGANTSNAGGGSTADGGGTYTNERSSWWRNRNSNRGYSIKGITRPFYGVTVEAVKAIQRAEKIAVDGKLGPNTVAAVKRVQAHKGLKVDGFPGPKTMAALAGDVVEAVEDVVDKVPGKAPAFPLPKGFFYGPRTGPQRSVSGHVRNSATDDVVLYEGHYHSKGLRIWQKRMQERGYKLEADGLYGPVTEAAARNLQRIGGVTVDGLIGDDTWPLAWTEPIR